eukprot:COSAG04_NODE_1550_length_6380_cov_2.250597_7_plen_150_part_00
MAWVAIVLGRGEASAALAGALVRLTGVRVRACKFALAASPAEIAIDIARDFNALEEGLLRLAVADGGSPNGPCCPTMASQTAANCWRTRAGDQANTTSTDSILAAPLTRSMAHVRSSTIYIYRGTRTGKVCSTTIAHRQHAYCETASSP